MVIHYYVKANSFQHSSYLYPVSGLLPHNEDFGPFFDESERNRTPRDSVVLLEIGNLVCYGSHLISLPILQGMGTDSMPRETAKLVFKK